MVAASLANYSQYVEEMRRVILALIVLVLLGTLTVQYVNLEGFTEQYSICAGNPDASGCKPAGSGDTVYLDTYKEHLKKFYEKIGQSPSMTESEFQKMLELSRDEFEKVYGDGSDLSDASGSASKATSGAGSKDTSSKDTSSKASKFYNDSKFLAEVEKTIRDEIKRARQTDTTVTTPGSADCSSPSLQQGASYCPKCPDMSEYIRKDQIPCWGCTLK